eukprot:3288831-Pleurochrysis_carterae.AAC.1
MDNVDKKWRWISRRATEKTRWAEVCGQPQSTRMRTVVRKWWTEARTGLKQEEGRDQGKSNRGSVGGSKGGRQRGKEGRNRKKARKRVGRTPSRHPSTDTAHAAAGSCWCRQQETGKTWSQQAAGCSVFQSRRSRVLVAPANFVPASKVARSKTELSTEMRLSEAPRNLASEKSVSVMTEPCRFAPSKFVCMPLITLSKMTQCNCAREKSEVRSTALLRSALSRMAPRKEAAVMSAALNLAPVRSAPSKIVPLRSVPRRSASLSITPVRSAPVKKAQGRRSPPGRKLAMHGLAKNAGGCCG